MSDQARGRILARLRAAPRADAPARPTPVCSEWAPPGFADQKERLARFTAMLQASHAEVHAVGRSDWPARLKAILARHGVRSLLYAPATDGGRRVAEAWSGDGPRLVAYDRPVEDLKGVLVDEVDAGLTTTLGGIAETGTLVLWPTPDEPRLMSLLPPIHVALVEAEAVAGSLAEVIAGGGWAAGMPTNALLISGPSKTADIEQTLAYGVHGPKALIVLLIGGETAETARSASATSDPPSVPASP